MLALLGLRQLEMLDPAPAVAAYVEARGADGLGVKTMKMASKPVDAKATRLRLGMSQEQFALRFALDLSAVENWEQGRRDPDPAALAYLRVIGKLPREAALAQEEEPA
jgi:putative transcriptional regulator